MYYGKENLLYIQQQYRNLLHFFHGDLMMLFALLSHINTKQHRHSETTIDCSKKDPREKASLLTLL